jgi:hypothetical protein
MRARRQASLWNGAAQRFAHQPTVYAKLACYSRDAANGEVVLRRGSILS